MQQIVNLAIGAAVLVALLASLTFASAQADMDDAVEDHVAAATVLVVASVLEVQNGIPTRAHSERPLGSGVLVSAEGHVVTNSHVVDLTELQNDVETEENTQGIDLQIQPYFLIYVVDGTDDDPDPRYRAILIPAANQPEFDLAVLQITGDEDGRALRRPLGDDRLPVALAPANSAETRDPVHVFGYPTFGNDAFTDFVATTIDVVDGKIRSFERGVGGANARLIYIDATVSAGSSGGAVVDDSGLLIGVVSQARSAAVGGSVAVAVPIDLVRAVLNAAGWTQPTPSPASAIATPTSTVSPTMTPTETPIRTLADSLTGNLTYGVEIAGQWDIYAYDFATNTSAPLAADPNSDELAPSYSHDGSKIAYVSDASGSRQAWVMDADGANPILVTDAPAHISYVAWTADDESLIVTASDEASDGYLAIVPATGGALQPFGPPGIIGFATVADDGRVAFVQFRGGDHDVLIANPSGEVIAALAETGEEEDAASISPDGSRVAYQVGLKGARRIEVVSTQGGPVERVGPYSRDDSNPVWSPDGMMIAYAASSGAATDGNADEIWVVTPGGGLPVRLDLKLPSFDQLWYLTWGPSVTRTSPTPVPTPTSTPSPVPFTPSPSPTPVVTPPLTELFPEVLPLVHATCFEVESEREFTLEVLASRFTSSEDAAAHLRAWGWQASADRAFGCEDPPTGEAGFVYISLHRFANATSAQQAVDYFAASLAGETTLTYATVPTVGDYAAALSGPAVNGQEFTLYTSSGPLLIRVTGVSPSGLPMGNVVAVAEAILTAQQGTSQVVTLQPQSGPSGPASAYLPSYPAVDYAECFSILSEGPYAYSDIASALQTWGLTQSDTDALGWQDGAYRSFTCADPPDGRAAQVDFVIHRFRDAQTAQQVAPYFAGTYGMETNESRSCDTAGSLVICVTARSLTGSPLTDVMLLLQQVVAAVG